MTGSKLREGSPYKADRKRLDFIPGKVIVRFRTDAMESISLAALPSESVPIEMLDGVPDEISQPMRALRANAGLTQARSVMFAHDVQGSAGPAVWRHLGKSANAARRTEDPARRMSGITVLDVDSGQRQEAIRTLKKSSAVQSVELMPARWLLASSFAKLRPSLAAIDWHVAKMPSTPGRKIAVLDTGIDSTHPSLADRIAAYETNGFSQKDLLGHGTHVAGIISGKYHPASGFRGVGNAKLLVWKIFDDKPEPTTGEFYVDFEAYLSSLSQVLMSDARVVNLSIGGTQKSAQEAFVFNLLHERGIVVVAAMGNEYESGNPIEYPGAYPGVLAVGAVDGVGKRAKFSNTGRHIGLVAPGVCILSTVPMKKSKYCEDVEFTSYDGTSMASPIVAAAANLLLAKNPKLTAAQAFKKLQSTAVKLPAQKGAGYSHAYGAGLLNLKRLLR
ncbi:S8 family serine peptidase [Luteimonas sp. MJ250]|uniref:S8 family peptidase n=1 Tax=Luteimonas sp. MJ250 TaxID=3129236 RepID=UPI0031BAF9C2